MRTPRLLRTATFRLAGFYAVLFAVGALVLVAFFDLTIAQYARSALSNDVLAELQLLLKTAPSGDAAGVASLVRERERVLGSKEFYYLVVSREGRVLAGDLPPSAALIGWGHVEIAAPPDDREYDAEMADVRVRGADLPGGGILVVGRSTYDFHELRETMMNGTITAAALITAMSLAAAFLIGRQFLKRIDAVSEAAARIMDGRLDERLPAIGMGDEFDRLALSLNTMLDRMQKLMEGLRQVSSDIAHDLRTPLMRLRRRLEAAMVARRGGAERQVLLEEALDQLDEILSTFGALLRIAQVEGGTGREGFRRVDLSELMERVRQAYEPVAEDAGKELAAQITPAVAVAGDEELLGQLISNLIENAFAHAGESEIVRLGVHLDSGRAVLSVADHGPGVPASERGKVMRRFYRLDVSRTTPGAGLGLSMVHAIAQLHGGEIELGDNGPGLVARVRLPLAASEP
jgi:signal transduction histidine kinase